MYIYPDNLMAKATLWLWALKDIGIIGIGMLLSIFSLVQLGFILPFVITGVYAFITLRFDDVSILDFVRKAIAFFCCQQIYRWGERE